MNSGAKIKIILLSIALCLLSILLITKSSIAAAGVNFYLDPSSVTVAQGENVTLTAKINSDSKDVDSVDIKLTYDETFLEFVSIDGSVGAFGIGVSEKGGSGNIQITRGALPPFVRGDAIVAKITFKAKSGSGPVNTNVEFIDSSVAVSEGETLDVESRTGTSINLGRNDDSNNNQNTQQGSNNNPDELINVEPLTPITVVSSNPAAPKLLDLFPKKVGFKNVVISWRTNVPTNSVIEYGLTKQLGFNVSSRELNTNHELGFEKPLTKPGQKYYYRAKSTNQEGEVTSSGIRYVYTRGYTAIIALIGKNNNLSGSEVVIDKNGENEKKSQLNNEAQATFNDLAVGDHTITISANGSEITQNIFVEDSLGIESGEDVADDAYVTPQYFRIEVESKKSNLLQLVLLLIGVLITASGGSLFIWKKYKNGGLRLPSFRLKRKNNLKDVQPTAIDNHLSNAASQKNDDDLDSLLERLPGDRINKPGNVIEPNKPEEQSDDTWE